MSTRIMSHTLAHFSNFHFSDPGDEVGRGYALVAETIKHDSGRLEVGGALPR